MTSRFLRGSSHLERRRVRVLLAGGQAMEGDIHIPEGQPLLPFLGMKRHFLNLTSVQVADAPEGTGPIEHLSLRLTNLVWVVPLDGSLFLSNAAPPDSSSREVELLLVDGLTLTVTLTIAEEQRMSDYLDANPGFLPLWSARTREGGEVIERLAVSHEAILAIRELSGGV